MTPSHRLTFAASALVGLVLLAAAGCATVHPWERGRLADPQMIFDNDAEQAAYDAHWQEAREGSTAGTGVQTGGCGCK